MERASIVCDGDTITAEDLELGSRIAVRPPQNRLAPGELAYDKAMERFERRLLTQAIVEAKGNVTRAAEILQMKRTTLHYRMKALGMPLMRQA